MIIPSTKDTIGCATEITQPPVPNVEYYIKLTRLFVKDRPNLFDDFKDEIIIPFFIRHRIYDSKKAFQSEKYKFNPLLDNNFIRNNRLKSQDVSAEFDQILVELKIK